MKKNDEDEDQVFRAMPPKLPYKAKTRQIRIFLLRRCPSGNPHILPDQIPVKVEQLPTHPDGKSG
jgi:hypothetical protein